AGQNTGSIAKPSDRPKAERVEEAVGAMVRRPWGSIVVAVVMKHSLRKSGIQQRRAIAITVQMYKSDSRQYQWQFGQSAESEQTRRTRAHKENGLATTIGCGQLINNHNISTTARF